MRTTALCVLSLCAAIGLAPTVGQGASVAPNGGFENGTLSAWEVLGDVSVQSGSLGISATEGDRYALASTLCDPRNASGIGEDKCEAGRYELPYSGTNAVLTVGDFPPSPPSIFAFVGLELTDYLFPNGEGSAIRRLVSGSIGDVLSIDYNFLTMESGGTDRGYVVLKGLGSMSGFRDLIFLQVSNAVFPSDVQLCERLDDPSLPSGYFCNHGLSTTQQSGWATQSFVLPGTGSYQLGLAVFEGTEGSVPSALLVDNLRLSPVPIPAAAWLFGGALGLLGVARRQSAA